MPVMKLTRPYLNLLSAACLIMLAGFACTNIKHFKQHMDRYIGQPIEKIQGKFGYNFIERKLENNQRAYTWTWTQTDFSPGHRTPDIIRTYQSAKTTYTYIIPGSYFPPAHYEFSCEFSFITNEHKRAIAWRAHGNGCASYPTKQDTHHYQSKKPLPR